VDHFLRIDLLRERKLDEDAVNVVIAIQAIDFREQLSLVRRVVEHQLRTAQAELICFLRFVANVELGGGIIADAHRDETRLIGEAADDRADLLFEVACYGFSIDQTGGHGAGFYHGMLGRVKSLGGCHSPDDEWAGMRCLTDSVRQWYRLTPF